MSARSTFGNLFRVLSHRNYGLFIAGNSISLIGNWMQRIAVGWATWELTGSGAWLGVMAFADLFPSVLIAPFAGAAADRWDRLRLIKLFQILACLAATTLAVMFATGRESIWGLFTVVLMLGMLFAAAQPIRMAVVSSLVPRNDLATAVAINAITFNLARFIGPAIAGVLIATAGIAWAFAANALALLVFLLALQGIRPSPAQNGAAAPRGSLLSTIAPGFRYTVRHPGIAAILLLMIGIGFGARPLIELLPGFAGAVFSVGPDGLAILTSSVGAGAIVGGIWLSGRRSAVGLTRIVLWSTGGMALSVLLFTTTTSMLLAMPFLAALGFCQVVGSVGSQTLVQLAVPDELRGRVLSFYGLILRGGPAIGALVIGVASDYLGLRVALALGGIVLAGLVLALAMRRRQIAESLEGKPTKAAPEPREHEEAF